MERAVLVGIIGLMQGLLHICCEDIWPSNHKRVFHFMILELIKSILPGSKQLSLSSPPSP